MTARRLMMTTVLAALGGCVEPPAMNDSGVAEDATIGTDAGDATIASDAAPVLDAAPADAADAAAPDAGPAGDAAVDATVDAARDAMVDAAIPDAAAMMDAAPAADGGTAASTCDSPAPTGPARLAVSQASLDFPTGTVSVLSEYRTIWVSNPGSLKHPAFSAEVSGAAAIDFSADVAGCSAVATRGLDPGEECYYLIRFAPRAAGARQATLHFGRNMATEVQVPLMGTGVAAGSIALSETELDLPTIRVGTQNGRQLTLKNTSAVTTASLNLQITGPDAARYSRSSGCQGIALAAGASCTVDITFQPSALGPATATLTVDGGAAGTATALLIGAGGAPTHFELCPAAVNLIGLAPVDLSERLILRNTGGVDDTVNWQLTGDSAFTLAPRCVTAAVGHTCEAVVRLQSSDFSRSFTGMVRASPYNGGIGAISSSSTLNGRSASGPQLAFALGAGVTNVVLGAVPVQSIAHRRVAVTNVGDYPTTALSMFHSFRSSPTALSVSSTTCGASVLEPGQSCDVIIAAAPTAAGSLNNVYDLRYLQSAVSMPTIWVNVAGSVTWANPVSNLRPRPDKAMFGQVRHGAGATMNVVLTNRGTQPTSVPVATIGGSAASEFQVIYNGCTAMLAANASCPMIIGFSPARGGPRRATLTMTSTPSGTAVTALEGNGETRITIVRGGSGFGSVQRVGGPALSCYLAPACTWDVGEARSTLRAVPEPGSAFVSWTGCDAIVNDDCEVETSAALRSVTASFSGPDRRIDILRSAGGTVVSTPAGIDCGATCGAVFTAGPVTLTPTPNPGKAFVGWSGPCAAAGTGACTTSAGGTIRAAFVDVRPCQLVINEVHPAFWWVELYNQCPTPITFDGSIKYRRSDDVSPAAGPDALGLAGVSGTIPGNGYLTVQTRSSALFVDDEWATMGGVALRDASGQIVDSMTVLSSSANAFTETSPMTFFIGGGEASTAAYGRFKDGVDSDDNSIDWVTFVATPGGTNH